MFSSAPIVACLRLRKRQTPTMMKRDTKKSETLQVRLPHGMKRDFMRRCETENRAASDLIRDFIEGYLAGPVEILTSEKAVMIRRTFIYPALAAAGLFGAVVVLSPATSQATSLRQDFAAMDADKDGFVVVSEYKRPDDGVTYSMSKTPTASASSPPSGWSHTVGVTRVDKNDGAAETFARLDSDGDHKLSFEEYRVMRVGSAMAILRRGDGNGDRRLTQAEYVEGSTLSASAVAQIKAKTPGTKIEQAVGQMRKAATARFTRLDADHDGLLTLEEMAPT